MGRATPSRPSETTPAEHRGSARCPSCQAPGPFFHHLEVEQRIEVVFDPELENGWRIAEGAKAREVSAYPTGFTCGACGYSFGNPLK